MISINLVNNANMQWDRCSCNRMFTGDFIAFSSSLFAIAIGKLYIIPIGISGRPAMPYPDFVYFIHVTVLLLIIGVLLSYVITGYLGAPYVPTASDRVIDMVRLADVRPGELAVDLGSGDGRIVIALAKAGAEVHGYEINPVLVLWARFRIYREGVGDRAQIYWRSFWGADLSEYQLISIYGNHQMMKRLEEKLYHELAPNARLVSCEFPFPRWRPLRIANEIYLYTRVGRQPVAGEGKV